MDRMIKMKTDAPTGPRAELAKAIEASRDAEAHCEALRASVRRIEDKLYAASEKLERSRERDEEAKAETVRAIVEGGDVAALDRPARSAVTEVERTIEACKSARQMVGDELAEAERSLEFKVMRVRDAAGAVVAAEALDEMIADAKRLRGELDAREAVLSFLHPSIARDQAAKIERTLASSEVRGTHPAVEPWRAALEALSRDAAAALPR
jgi:chromosome segregation ATPase